MPLHFAHGFYIFHFSYRKLNSGLSHLHLQFFPCYELNSHSKNVCRSPQSPAPGNAIFFAQRITAHVISQDEVLLEQRGTKVQRDSCPNKKKRDLDRHKDNAVCPLSNRGRDSSDVSPSQGTSRIPRRTPEIGRDKEESSPTGFRGSPASRSLRQ